MATLPKNKRLGGRPVVGGSKVRDNKPKPKSHANGHMPARFGAIGGYKGVSTKYVNRLVKGLIRPEINDLRLQKNQLNHDTVNAVRHAREDYARGEGDLQYVHGETDDYLKGLTQKNNALYGDTQGQINAAGAALQNQLGATYGDAQSSAAAELARLGISGGGNFGQMGSDLANARAVGAQATSNAGTTASLAGSNVAGALQMLQGMNQGSLMQGIGQNLNVQQTALADIRAQRSQGLQDIRQAMVDARGSRKDAYLQLLQQLQQTGWGQYLQAQQLHDSRKQQHWSNKQYSKQTKKYNKHK